MNKIQQIQKDTNTGRQNTIIWTSNTEYYDIETGMELTKKTATNTTLYIKIKTNKHVQINHNTAKGTIRYTIECRKQPQQRLF